MTKRLRRPIDELIAESNQADEAKGIKTPRPHPPPHVSTRRTRISYHFSKKDAMSTNKEPSLVSNPVQATVMFTAPNKPLGYGHGFVVRFAVPPKVGDIVEVDQYSIRSIPMEELHQPTWRVVDVHHDLSLRAEEGEDCPVASLRVTLHPKRARARG